MKPTKISIRSRYVRCPHCLERYVKLPDNSIVCPGCDFKGPSSFFLDFYHSGRQQIFSDERGILLDTKARAELLAEQIRYEINKGTFLPDKYRRAELKKYWTDNLLDEFWKVKQKVIAPSALNNYRRMIEVAKQFIGTRDVRDIRKIHLIEYQNHLVSIPVGPKTIWNYLSLFKTFLNWCKNDLGILSLVPPFPSVEQQEEPQINWVSAEDQIKLLSHARVEDRPLLIFLMLSGTRPSEARALKVSDVDLDKGLIYVRGSFSGTVYRQKRKGKGAKGYAIPIHTEILPYIQQRLKSALPGAWLFPSPRHGGPFSYQRLAKAWNLIRQRAGITYRLRLYDATRHSLASGLLAKGESLFTVSKLLGHQDMKTTMRYAHPDLESLRKSISKVSLLKESEPEQVAKKKGIKG